MADMDHLTNNEAEPTSPVVPSAHETRRKRKARRDPHSQDDVPHHAASRAIPARLEKALALVARCAEIADDNRAKDILLLDLRQATPLIDFFLIATASTRRLANAIAIEIDVEMKKAGEFKLGMEGTEEGSWILIDYGDFVVHLFTPESRTYYSLEEVWGDAPHVDWKAPVLTEPPAQPASE
jgi:ribosome-associated protein